MKSKTIKGTNKEREKRIAISVSISSDKETPIWCFDNVDNDGQFRLSIDAIDSHLMMEKLLTLSKMTWAMIKQATHDENKSKNHYLDYTGISEAGKKRMLFKGISETSEDIDIIFSIALTNMIRLIGKKDGRVFHAIWYDKKHEFYPSNKK